MSELHDGVVARVDLGWGSLHTERYGDGPPVLAISGSGGDLRRSAPAAHPLNREFRVLHYDHRGLGRSDDIEAPPTMASFADDAAALVRAVGWDRCHVVGVSFGGMVAQHLAIRHPDVVDRLVLCCTSPGGDHASYPLHELADLEGEERADVLFRLFDRRYDPSAAEPVPGLGRAYGPIRDGLGLPRSHGATRQLAARSHHDVTGELGRIEAPTLVCAGVHDDIAPLDNAEVIVAGVPDARLATFDGGHLFLMQDRTAYPTIAAFLRGDDPA
ncbi:MAG: alpha/beta fold hydrolase [Actinomycetota bacterium]|nr:alpha/beta fold hydrolase [Actinomycetota bacterium]